MGFDNECFYCTKDQRLQELMIEVCRLKRSTVFLFKDQTFRGRCVVAYNDHVSELFQLSPSELHEYMDEVARVAAVVAKACGPDKITYAIFGDIVSHIHYHIVPKYKNGPLWGEFFCSKPLPITRLPEDECKALKRIIQDGLM